MCGSGHKQQAVHGVLAPQYKDGVCCRIVGDWDVSTSAELKWNEGDRWSCTVELPAGRIVEYKYVVLASDGGTATAWQLGNNSVLAIQGGEKTVEVFDNWCG